MRIRKAMETQPVRLDLATIKAVEQVARTEDRSLTNMLRVLTREALAARGITVKEQR